MSVREARLLRQRRGPGLPKNKVIVPMTLSGGSFWRRAQWDYAAEAWQVAREVKKPVQSLWTREDDIQHDFHREYTYDRLTGSIDEPGRVTAWSHRVVCTPIRPYFDSPESLKDPAHVAEVGGADPAYSCPNVRIDFSRSLSGAARMVAIRGKRSWLLRWNVLLTTWRTPRGATHTSSE